MKIEIAFLFSYDLKFMMNTLPQKQRLYRKYECHPGHVERLVKKSFSAFD